MREDWKVKNLGDVCQIIGGGTPSKKVSEYYNGNILWATVRDMNCEFLSHTDLEISEKGLKNSSSNLIKKGEVIIATRVGLGKVCILNQDTAINQDLKGLVPLKDNLKRKFLFYWYKSLADKVNSDGIGMTVKGVNLNYIKALQIPIPPIPEQKQIVAILDKAFAAIDQAQANIEKNIGNTKELFQSKLNEIFSQKGEGWEEKTLGQIGKVSMCKRILKKQTNTKNGIPFYKIGTFGKKADAYISKEIYDEYKSKYSFPKKGDILLSASGTIGRRVVYDGEAAYFQDSNIVWIANNEELVLNEFLYEFYGFCDWNPSRGATISRLYNDDLRRIKIYFPNRESQKRLVNEIKLIYEGIESIELRYHQKLSNLAELKKSILQKAFAGELTSTGSTNKTDLSEDLS